jgi:hypothetical protein
VESAADDLVMASPAAWISRVLPEGSSLSDEVWAERHKRILAVLWLHLPAIFLFTQYRHLGLVHGLVETAMPGGFAVMAYLWRDARRWTTLATTFGLLTCSAVMVHASGGVIEMHFHYFVMVALITQYQEREPFLLAILYVVLQHGVAGVVDPSAVYNHHSAIEHPWNWAAVHGAFVLAMSSVGVATWRFNESLLSDVRHAAGSGTSRPASWSAPMSSAAWSSDPMSPTTWTSVASWR